MDSRCFRAEALWTGEELVHDIVVEVDGRGRVRDLRSPQAIDPSPTPGLVVPGLINAHVHLELSCLEGRVAGGEGLPAWMGALRRAQELDAEAVGPAMWAAARELKRLGVAGVSDVSMDGASTGPLLQAGISGVVHVELLSMDGPKVRERVRAARELGGEVLGRGARIWLRPSPHALYSTAPAIVRATTEWGKGRPEVPRASIHVAEDREEVRFIERGDGLWAAMLDRLGVEWRWWEAPGLTPVAFLDQLGVLDDVLLVHGVYTSPQERALLARRGAPLCLCPRSNLHVVGELPAVDALWKAGVSLAMGTDSLAAAPDLDVLAEIPVLAQAFPEVPAEGLLRAVTAGGADAVRLPWLGRIRPGSAPGLLLLEDATSPEDLRRAAPRRRWLVEPGTPPGPSAS